MKTYYFGVIATIGSCVVQGFYAVEATQFDAAQREVAIETEWIWSKAKDSSMFELSAFLFEKLKASQQVDGIVLGKQVPA